MAFLYYFCFLALPYLTLVRYSLRQPDIGAEQAQAKGSAEECRGVQGTAEQQSVESTF